jgi:hypothetical protein
MRQMHRWPLDKPMPPKRKNNSCHIKCCLIKVYKILKC